MMSDKQNEFQNAFMYMFKKLDEDYFRKMQRDTHLCSAKCCDDTSMSMESVQRCVTNCSAPVTISQEYVSREMRSFQERLERCARDCEDNIRDKITSKDDVSTHQREYESCVHGCADKFIKLLPSLATKIGVFANEKQVDLDRINM